MKTRYLLSIWVGSLLLLALLISRYFQTPSRQIILVWEAKTNATAYVVKTWFMHDGQKDGRPDSTVRVSDNYLSIITKKTGTVVFRIDPIFSLDSSAIEETPKE